MASLTGGNTTGLSLLSRQMATMGRLSAYSELAVLSVDAFQTSDSETLQAVRTFLGFTAAIFGIAELGMLGADKLRNLARSNSAAARSTILASTIDAAVAVPAVRLERYSQALANLVEVSPDVLVHLAQERDLKRLNFLLENIHRGKRGLLEEGLTLSPQAESNFLKLTKRIQFIGQAFHLNLPRDVIDEFVKLTIANQRNFITDFGAFTDWASIRPFFPNGLGGMVRAWEKLNDAGALLAKVSQKHLALIDKLIFNNLNFNLFVVGERIGVFVNDNSVLLATVLEDATLQLESSQLVNILPSTTPAFELNRIEYVVEGASAELGNLKFYNNLEENNSWRCFIENLLPSSSVEFNDFYSLFIQKQWDWHTYFTPTAASYISSLPPPQRLALKSAFNSWITIGNEEFARLFDNLSLNYNQDDLNQTILNGIIEGLNSLSLNFAIDDAILYLANNELITLKGHFDAFKRNEYLGVVSLEEIIYERGITIRSILNELPEIYLGTGGLSNTILLTAFEELSNGYFLNAITELIASNTEIQLQKELIWTRAITNQVKANYLYGLISFIDWTEKTDEIISQLLNQLPNVALGHGSLTESSIQTAIDYLFIGNSLGAAITHALINCSDPVKSKKLTFLSFRCFALDQSNMLGVVSYEDFTLLRNRIRLDFIEEISPTFTPGSGLTPELVISLEELAANNLMQAIDETIMLNNNFEEFYLYIQLKARHIDLLSDKNSLIISDQEYLTNLNLIRGNFISLLSQ